MKIIQEFFQNEVDYFLANLRVYLLKGFLRSIWILFINNIDIKVRVYPLFNNFGGNYIIFIFLSYLPGYYRF